MLVSVLVHVTVRAVLEAVRSEMVGSAGTAWGVKGKGGEGRGGEGRGRGREGGGGRRGREDGS